MATSGPSELAKRVHIARRARARCEGLCNLECHELTERVCLSPASQRFVVHETIHDRRCAPLAWRDVGQEERVASGVAAKRETTLEGQQRARVNAIFLVKRLVGAGLLDVRVELRMKAAVEVCDLPERQHDSLTDAVMLCEELGDRLRQLQLLQGSGVCWRTKEQLAALDGKCSIELERARDFARQPLRKADSVDPRKG
jgi:hypothetical protein